MLQLPEFTTAKITHAQIGMDLHGTENVPRLDMQIVFDSSNKALDDVEPGLRAQFYLAADTVDLESIDHMPDLRTEQIEMPLLMKKRYAGYRLEIDFGLGAEGGSNIEIGECELSKLRVTLKQGARCEWHILLQQHGIDQETGGQITFLQKREVKIRLLPPTDGEAHPMPKKPKKAAKVEPIKAPTQGDEGPPPDAGDIFAQQHSAPAKKKPSVKAKMAAASKRAAKKNPQ